MYVIEELAECDFGKFENKNFHELSGDPEYQQWIDSDGSLPFPEGESREEFAERSLQGFEKAIEECRMDGIQTVVFVVHGGTIMSIMERHAYPAGDYFDYQVENGDGYEIVITDGREKYIRRDGECYDNSGRDNLNISCISGIPVRSSAGGSVLAVSSGTADWPSHFFSGKNYSKLFSKE